MVEKRISSIVVLDDDRLAGIFTERNFVRFAARCESEVNGMQIRELMTTSVVTAPGDMEIFTAYNLLHLNRIRHLVVVDSDGRVIGIVTLSDLVAHLGYEYFIEFRQISQVMSSIIFSVSRKTNIVTALKEMARISASCLVVEEDDCPVGILTERDIIRLPVTDPGFRNLRVEEVMSSPVHTISADKSVLDTTRIMQEKKIRRVIVVDRDGRMRGIITQSDIVKGLETHYIRQLQDVIRDKDLTIQHARQKLSEKSHCLDNILNSFVDIGVVATDANHRVVFFSPSAEKILKVSATAHIGRHLQEIHGENRVNTAGFSRVVDSIWKDRIHTFMLKNGTGADGRHIQGRVSGMWDHDGRYLGLVLIVQDVTERKVNALEIERQKKKLVVSNIVLSTLYEVASIINQMVELQSLLEEVLVVITALPILQVKQKAGIFLLKDERLELAAHIGHEDVDTFATLHNSIRIGDSLCGLAVGTGEIIVSDNCTIDPRHTVKTETGEPHGCILVPIRCREEVIGVLYLYTLDSFQELDHIGKDLLNGIASQLGVAVENLRLYEETRYLALHDPLTRVANRRFLDITLNSHFLRARRYKKDLSLIMLDIDHFKRFNDERGHDEGDKALVRIAGLLQENVRESDFLARYGGEEFLVILPETSSNYACFLGERMREVVERETENTISLGIASFAEEMQREEDLVRAADNMLYKAKRNGRNRLECSGNRGLTDCSGG